MKLKVLNVSYSRYERDSRIKKIVKSISEENHSVYVVALTDEASSTYYSSRSNHVFLCGSGPTWLKKIRIIYLLYRYLTVLFRSILLSKRVNLVIVNDISTWLIFLFFKLFTTTQIWYDCHEYSPNDYPDGKWKEKTWVKFVEKYVIRHADVVTVVSEGIKKNYQKLYQRKDLHVLRNIPVFRTNLKKKLSSDLSNRKIDVVYQGVYAPGRGIEALLILISANAQQLERYRFNFFGGGCLDSSIREVESKHPNLIKNHGWIDEENLEAATATMDIGYCVIEPLCKSYDLSLPNKFFQYCHAGTPVIVGASKELSQVVRNFGLGLEATSTDFTSVLDHIIDNYDDMSAACVQYAKNNTWESDFNEVMKYL